ncbi:hypothetical protein PO909_008497, partial [Leuciscus waleckii]
DHSFSARHRNRAPGFFREAGGLPKPLHTRLDAEASPRLHRRGIKIPPQHLPIAQPSHQFHPPGKWIVIGLRQALINSDVQFSRKMNKAELYNHYVSLQSANLSPKSTPAPKTANRQNGSKRLRIRLARQHHPLAAPQIPPLSDLTSRLQRRLQPGPPLSISVYCSRCF